MSIRLEPFYGKYAQEGLRGMAACQLKLFMHLPRSGDCDFLPTVLFHSGPDPCGIQWLLSQTGALIWTPTTGHRCDRSWISWRILFQNLSFDRIYSVKFYSKWGQWNYCEWSHFNWVGSYLCCNYFCSVPIFFSVRGLFVSIYHSYYISMHTCCPYCIGRPKYINVYRTRSFV